MKSVPFFMLFRFDIEPFCYDRAGRRCLLYPPRSLLFDQSVLLRRIVDILDAHGARGSFAVAHDIVRNAPQMMRPILESRGAHELTYHLHPAWDRQLEKDFGRRMTSAFLAHYDGPDVERMIDLAEKAFQAAYSFRPKVSHLGNASVSTAVLNVFERKGYLVQGDYIPNMDYRLNEGIARSRVLHGRYGFINGSGAPLAPYAPDSIYTPNRHDGMLLGDMGIVAIPISQIEAGEGLRIDTAFVDPLLTMEAIGKAHGKRTQPTSFMIVTHTCFGLVTGPEAGNLEETYLANLDRTLRFTDGLRDIRYCTCMDARRRYLSWAEKRKRAYPFVRDVTNGLLVYDGRQSVKFHAVGTRGKRPAVTISQESGIAEWLYGDVPLGPKAGPKRDWDVVRRPGVLAPQVIRGGVMQEPSAAELPCSYKVDRKRKSVVVDARLEGVRNIYTIRRGELTLCTRTEFPCEIIHRVNCHPGFLRSTTKRDGVIAFSHGGFRKTLVVKSTADSASTFRDTSGTGLRMVFRVPDASRSCTTHLILKEGENAETGGKRRKTSTERPLSRVARKP